MRRDLPDVSHVVEKSALPARPEIVIRALQPLLTEERIRRLETIINQRTRSVIAVLDGLIDPHNTAAILRSADAFGTQEVHVIERDEPFIASTRVTTGAERWLDLIRHSTAERCVNVLRDRGFRVYVATSDGELNPFDLARIERVAVVFGNEHSGVRQEFLQYSDGSYGIPMRGFVQSLNVSVATAITLHAATVGRSGDLTSAERTMLRARFMMLSVRNATQVVLDYLRRHEG
ncbi:MAG: RNA methyltransferase [Deltaproteobacteria bacterium]|nr:RNA methyltransferase [Deltaproteobacteria bacterium]